MAVGKEKIRDDTDMVIVNKVFKNRPPEVSL
jgi:hypothetical protein